MKWLHSRALAATGDTGGNHWMARGTAGGGGGAVAHESKRRATMSGEK